VPLLPPPGDDHADCVGKWIAHEKHMKIWMGDWWRNRKQFSILLQTINKGQNFFLKEKSTKSM
jgi:hypothetical protein